MNKVQEFFVYFLIVLKHFCCDIISNELIDSSKRSKCFDLSKSVFIIAIFEVDTLSDEIHRI